MKIFLRATLNSLDSLASYSKIFFVAYVTGCAFILCCPGEANLPRVEEIFYRLGLYCLQSFFSSFIYSNRVNKRLYKVREGHYLNNNSNS